MSIWHQEPNLDLVNARGAHTMVEYLEIEFTEIGDDYMVARMPVDHRTVQPLGLLHGGANCVLAETVGSVAANWAVDHERAYCVGLEINASHLRSAMSGYVFATARPVRLGRTVQVWDIQITNEEGRLSCVSRLTLAVVERKEKGS